MEDQAARHERRSWEVPPDLESIRLDSFVRRCLTHLSRREIEEALRARLFVIHGKFGKKGDRLAAGDVVIFAGPGHWLAAHPSPDVRLEISIVYEDLTLLVLNKPAGVATHGFSGKDTNTLANFLLAKRPNLVGVGKSRWEPGLVHRLDMETSGLVIVAKTQGAFDRLRNQLRLREIKKKYSALVWGTTAPYGVIDVSLAHDPRDERRMQPVKNLTSAKKQRLWHAVTHFRKRGEAQGLSFLDLQMTTGVTHQIRVHLAAIGHAIVGDSLYGANTTETFGLTRHFLHAGGLEFRHPDDGRMMKLEARLPSELRDVLVRLQLRL